MESSEMTDSCMACGHSKPKAFWAADHPRYFVCVDCRDSIKAASHLRLLLERTIGHIKAQLWREQSESPFKANPETIKLHEAICAALEKRLTFADFIAANATTCAHGVPGGLECPKCLLFSEVSDPSNWDLFPSTGNREG